MLKNNFAKIISILFLLCAMIPIVFLFSSLWRIENSNWNHLTLYLLPEISKNSMFLSLGVVACSTLIAIPIAYIQTFYDFPGRKLFDIFFLLPIVFPIYVYAAISLTLFGLTGDITSWLSSKLNISPFYFNIKNLFGLIIVFSFTLYPYLFITMREAFETHGERSLLVAKSLGLTKRNALFKILIPLTRPWYSAGVILVIMEVLADFGATSLFNINTFTTAIYRAWFGLFSFDTASQIASLFLIIIFLAVFLYRNNEERKNYSMSSKYLKIEKQKLIGWKLISVYFFYFIFLIIVIGLPLFFLLKEVFLLLRNNWIIFSKFDFFGPLKNSFNFGLSGAIVILLFAYVLGYAKRFELSRKDLWWFELTKLGYAIPGTIMAVAIYVPMSIIEKKFVGKNVLTITVIPLIVGYILRFLPVALNPIEVSFKKISESHVQFTKIIGLSNYYKWMKFYFPMTASAAIYSFCMLFLEIIKELPITLMTRPFGNDTLAIKIFEYTSESDWSSAAVPSLLLVCLGGIAVLIIYFKLKDKIN